MAVSPDGKKIVIDRVSRWDVEFRHYRGGQNTALRVMDLASLAETEIPAERSMDIRARWLAAGTDAPTHVQANAIWLRISAAAYNDIEDYERLADIVARMLRELP